MYIHLSNKILHALQILPSFVIYKNYIKATDVVLLLSGLWLWIPEGQSIPAGRPRVLSDMSKMGLKSEMS